MQVRPQRAWRRCLFAAALLLNTSCGTAESGSQSEDDASAQVDTKAAVDTAVTDTTLAAVDVQAAVDTPTVAVDAPAPAPVDLCETDTDCLPLEDGDACNGSLFCSKVGAANRCIIYPTSLVVCDAALDSICKQNQCNPKTGDCAQVAVHNDAACEDGDPCTVGDKCAAGACEGGAASWCECKSDVDCAAVGGGNKCVGAAYCAKAVFPWRCTLNAASKVNCGNFKDTACSKNACDPGTGKCAMTDGEKLELVCPPNQGCYWAMAPQGKQAKPPVCDDGDPCTSGENCKAGECTGGADTCKCSKNADCDKLEDADLCNGVLYCDTKNSACKVNPATVPKCPTAQDTACAKSQCIAASGACALAPVKPGTACEDGDKCSAGDVCVSGKCQGGKNTCLCKNDADCASKDDGDKCNGVLFYKSLKVPKCQLNPATVTKCGASDDTACRKKTCQPKTGKCQFKAVDSGAACDDGNKCTVSDYCVLGACQGGANTCECEANSDCAVKDDGNLCNGNFYCDKSGAKPKCVFNKASKVTCSKLFGQPCLDNQCNPQTGQCSPQPRKTGTACDDDNLCTDKDACLDGACKGAKKICDDSDLCTKDACLKGSGCAHTKVVCGDGNSCTADACNPKKGDCAHTATTDGSACTADTNGCTVGEHCKAGLCKAGKAIICKLPVAACEKPVCQSKSPTSFQCVVLPRDKGEPCDDGDSCTIGSACDDKGQCSGKGKPLLFERTLTPTFFGAASAGWLRDVAETVDGGLVVVGAQGKSGAGELLPSAWWVRYVDAAGTTLAEPQMLLPKSNTAIHSPHATVGASAVAIADNGVAVISGTSSTKSGGRNFAVYRLDAKRTIKSSKEFGGAAGSDEVAHDMALLDDGSAVVVGYKEKAAKQTWLAMRVTAAGQAQWQTEGTGTGNMQAHAVTRLKNGDIAMAGTRQLATPGPRQGFVVVLSPLGKLLRAKVEVGANDIDRPLHAISARPDGGYTVGGGWQGKGKLAFGRVAQYSAVHKPISQWLASNPSMVHGLVAAPAAGVIATGELNTTGQDADLLLGHLDGLDNLHWQRSYDGNFNDVGYRVQRHAHGGLLVAGGTEVKTASGKVMRRGLLRRSDPWGHASCEGAGVCRGKQADACDDGKACTRDRCDAKKGCLHSDVNGFRCKPGYCAPLGSCQSNTCVPDDNGKYHQKDIELTSGDKVGAIALTKNGYITAHASQTTPAKNALWHVVRRDALGNPLKEDVFSPVIANASSYSVDAIAAYPDGSHLVVGSTCGTTTQLYNRGNAVMAARFASDGALVFTWKYVPLPSPNVKGPAPVTVRGVAIANNGDAHIIGATLQESGCPAKSMYLLKNPGFASPRPLYTRFPAAGLQGAKLPPRIVYGGKIPGTMTAVVVGTGNTVVIAGSVWDTVLKVHKATLFTVDATANGVDYLGTSLVQHHHDVGAGSGVSARYVALARDGAKGYVALALVAPKLSAQRYTLVRINNLLQVASKKVVSSNALRTPVGLSLLASGDILLSGTEDLGGGGVRPWLQRVDANFAPLWSRDYKPSKSLTLAAGLLPLANGGVLLAGGRQDKDGTKLGFVLRTDPWGHASCTASGACVKKTAGDCDDGKACTAGVCQATSGKCSQLARSGNSCEDGALCSVHDRCQQGTCKAAGEKLAIHQYTFKTEQIARSLHARPDGGMYALSWSQGASNNYWRRWHAIHLDKSGDITWRKQSAATEGWLYAHFGDVASNGDLLIAGYYLSGTNWGLGISRLTAGAGALTAAKYTSPGKFNKATNLIGFAALSDGKHLAMITRTPTGIDKLSNDAKSVWRTSVTPEKVACQGGCPYGLKLAEQAPGHSYLGPHDVAKVVATSDGGLLAVLNAEFILKPAGQVLQPILYRLNLLGAVKWTLAPQRWRNSLIRSAAQLKDGTFVTVGEAGLLKSTARRFWLMRVDTDGQVLWHKETRRGVEAATSVIALADGGYAWAGARVVSGLTLPWLARASANGQRQWEREWHAPGAVLDTAQSFTAQMARWMRQTQSLTELSDGRVAAFASMQLGKDKMLGLAMFDAFGGTSCAKAGTCFAKKVGECDDKNPCTLDTCTGGKCTSTAHTDGARCGVDSHCVASKCTKAPKAMVLVPAGSFWMGCNSKASKDCVANEKPQHKVTLSSYWIDRYEVSVHSYKACAAAGKCTKRETCHNSTNHIKPGVANGMWCMDRKMATDYCAWAGGRLPTEAEWAKAARGGCELYGEKGCKEAMPRYPWGNEPPQCSYAAHADRTVTGVSWGCYWAPISGSAGQRPEGQSPYGLHDMAGSVEEWVQDAWDPNYYAKSSAKDPLNKGSGASDVGWRRGGFRAGNEAGVPQFLRSAIRLKAPLKWKSHPPTYGGVRCVRSTK